MHTIRPWLSIGNYRDRQDPSLLQHHQIGAMLQLAGLVEYPTIDTLYLPIEDGEPIQSHILARGVAWVLAQRASGKHILVACGAGISRSTSFAIAALKEAEQCSLLEAAQVVRRSYPNGMPHQALWASLCAYYQEPISYVALLRAHEVPE